MEAISAKVFQPMCEFAGMEFGAGGLGLQGMLQVFLGLAGETDLRSAVSAHGNIRMAP